MTNKVNVTRKFTAFTALWSPKLIAECNGQHVRIATGQLFNYLIARVPEVAQHLIELLRKPLR